MAKRITKIKHKTLKLRPALRKLAEHTIMTNSKYPDLALRYAMPVKVAA